MSHGGKGMHAMRGARSVLAVTALFAAVAAAGADKNLLPNGDFSTLNKLAGWNCGATVGSSSAWSSDDAAASASSGSVELVAVGYFDPIQMIFSFGDASCVSSCMNVRPGAAYRAGGQSRLVSGFAAPSLQCFEFADASCSIGESDLNVTALSALATWNATPATASGILLPTTHSASCAALATDISATTVHIDNLFFTTDAIFASGFETP